MLYYLSPFSFWQFNKCSWHFYARIICFNYFYVVLHIFNKISFLCPIVEFEQQPQTKYVLCVYTTQISYISKRHIFLGHSIPAMVLLGAAAVSLRSTASFFTIRPFFWIIFCFLDIRALTEYACVHPRFFVYVILFAMCAYVCRCLSALFAECRP